MGSERRRAPRRGKDHTEMRESKMERSEGSPDEQKRDGLRLSLRTVAAASPSRRRGGIDGDKRWETRRPQTGRDTETLRHTRLSFCRNRA